MASFSKFRDDLESDVGDQLASLQKEVAVLRKQVKKQSSQVYDDASETIADMIDSFLTNTKGARKEIYSKARFVENTAKENPVATTAVGITIIGLLIAFFFSRR
ncbi:hypothetical protein JYU29_17750 [Tianweitania sp. BSSL-BM11]|uniref:DUF883 domain-containing protein n=1 Tax=Tianweitania aestuarii TaxID=2814886 RepID=A0ABS5RZQ3_9HYPH|nr:hypothetical protein [Tianweitania aestuarii]MBS9722543.1 hypothetical protein [Tianweitania aestuarii]